MTIQVKQVEGVFDEFCVAIGKAAEARVLRQVRKLAQEGNALRSGSKPLGDGVFELTISFDKKEYRVAYVFHAREAVILHCFIKKSRKTPRRDLELARDRFRKLVAKEMSLGDVTVH